MHHPVSGINSLIHSVSLASHVLTHLLTHLSAHLYHHHHSHHPSPLHSFTPGSKPTFSINPSHLTTNFLLPCTAFTITGPDRTYHAARFIFSFFSLIFLFVPCGGLSWVQVSFLLHVKYTLLYRIVSVFVFNWSYVSRTVSKIFRVKNWRDLETGGMGRTRSLKMAPIDRSYTTFYWSAIVNIVLSCIVLSYLTWRSTTSSSCFNFAQNLTVRYWLPPANLIEIRSVFLRSQIYIYTRVTTDRSRDG